MVAPAGGQSTFSHSLTFMVACRPGYPLTYGSASQELYVKVVVFLAVTQGMGGFLVVMNHKFGGFLLVRTPLTCSLVQGQNQQQQL